MSKGAFSKLFPSMYDGTLAEDWHVLITFQQLLILRDWRTGIVDLTLDAIHRRTNIPLEVLRHGIERLEQPDTRSRTPDEEGRRIVRLDPHRDWGWRIVNHEKYRDLLNHEERAAYKRTRWHEKYKLAPSRNGAAPAKALPKPPKTSYGEFGHVRLTDTELEKLTDRLDVPRRDELITALDLEVEANGRKVKSAYATILKWAHFRKEKDPAPGTPPGYRPKGV